MKDIRTLWIDASESLPEQTREEESDRVLVYKTDINGDDLITTMSYNHAQGFWNTITGTCKVKYWMPLPELPKEPPLPEIERNQYVWVRDYGDWHPVRFSHFSGKRLVAQGGSKWDEYMVINPYHDSIEAQAIVFLKKISQSGIKMAQLDYETAGKMNKINKFLEQIKKYETQ